MAQFHVIRNIYSPSALLDLRLESVYSLKDDYFSFFDVLDVHQAATRKYLEILQFFAAPFAADADLIESAESILIQYVFSIRSREPTAFPILDNSNRVIPSIYGSGITITNSFPPSISVAHLSATIAAPTSR